MFEIDHGNYKRFDTWTEFLVELRKPSRKIRIVSRVSANPTGTLIPPGPSTFRIKGLPFSPEATFEQGTVTIDARNFKSFEIAQSVGFHSFGQLNGAE